MKRRDSILANYYHSKLPKKQLGGQDNPDMGEFNMLRPLMAYGGVRKYQQAGAVLPSINVTDSYSPAAKIRQNELGRQQVEKYINSITKDADKSPGGRWMKQWYSDPIIKNRITYDNDTQQAYYLDKLNKYQDKDYGDLFNSMSLFKFLPYVLGSQGVSILHGNESNPKGIYVNNTTADDLEGTRVHELTHLLDNNGSFYNSEIASLLSPFGYKRYDEIPGKYNDSNWLGELTDKYYLNPTEIHARMNEARYKLGLKPSDKFTEKMFDKILKEDDWFGLGNYIKDKKAFIDLMNTFVSNNTTSSNMAKYGGPLNAYFRGDFELGPYNAKYGGVLPYPKMQEGGVPSEREWLTDKFYEAMVQPKGMQYSGRIKDPKKRDTQMRNVFFNLMDQYRNPYLAEAIMRAQNENYGSDRMENSVIPDYYGYDYADITNQGLQDYYQDYMERARPFLEEEMTTVPMYQKAGQYSWQQGLNQPNYSTDRQMAVAPIQQRAQIQQSVDRRKEQERIANSRTFVGPAAKSTPDSEQRRYELNKQYALENNLKFNYKTGEVANLKDPTAKGKDWGRVNTPELIQTAAMATPSGRDYDAGAAGANVFVNMNPITAPITSAGRLTQLAVGQNPYGFNSDGVASNILPTIGVLGDVAGVGSFKMLPGSKYVTELPKNLTKNLSVGINEGLDLGTAAAYNMYNQARFSKPMSVIRDIPRAKNIQEVLGRVAGIPLNRDIARLGAEDVKAFRQVQEIGRLRATNASHAEQMRYALENNLPEEHFQKIFNTSRKEAQELLDSGFGQREAARSAGIRSRINLQRTDELAPPPEQITINDDDITRALGIVEGQQANLNALRSSASSDLRRTFEGGIDFRPRSATDEQIQAAIEVQSLRDELRARFRAIDAQEGEGYVTGSYRPDYENINITPESNLNWDRSQRVQDLINRLPNPSSEYTDNLNDLIRRVGQTTRGQMGAGTPKPQGIPNRLRTNMHNLRQNVSNKLENFLNRNIQKYPYYSGDVLYKVPSLSLAGLKNLKEVSKKVNFAPEGIQSGDVFTGSTNTSHSSYLPQLKQIFKYTKGDPQFIGYYPMNDLGFLSNFGYSHKDISRYLNSEIDELIKRGIVPKNVLRPFLKGEHVVLPHYAIKQHKKGGIIKDDRGQWAYPGMNTRISSPNITMQGVPYPVLAQASNGQQVMMYPGLDYYFPGAEYVDEYPMMQPGGQADNLKSFVTNWNNSPMGKQMLEASVDKDDPVGLNSSYADKIRKQRDFLNTNAPVTVTNQEDLNRLHGSEDITSTTLGGFAKPDSAKNASASSKLLNIVTNPSVFGHFYGTGAKHDLYTRSTIDPESHKYKVFSKDFDGNLGQQNETLVHELSHANDYGGLFIPESDKKKMDKYAHGWDVGMPMRKKLNDFQEYVAQPTETRARLMNFRYNAANQKLYNPFKEKVSLEQLNKYQSTPGGYDPLEQLREVYTDRQIVDMLNSISKAPTQTNTGNTARYGMQYSMMQKGGKKSPPPTLEQKIDRWLDFPMDRAGEEATNFGGLENDEVDNFRHAMAGRYTTEAIANKFPSWMQYTSIPKAAGFVGSNVLGLGHEIMNPNRNKDYNWWDVIREGGEDVFNNFVGSVIGSIPLMSDDQKTKTIQYLSEHNLLPDGYGKGDMYFKQDGGWPIEYQKGGGFFANLFGGKGGRGSVACPGPVCGPGGKDTGGGLHIGDFLKNIGEGIGDLFSGGGGGRMRKRQCYKMGLDWDPVTKSCVSPYDEDEELQNSSYYGMNIPSWSYGSTSSNTSTPAVGAQEVPTGIVYNYTSPEGNTPENLIQQGRLYDGPPGGITNTAAQTAKYGGWLNKYQDGGEEEELTPEELMSSEPRSTYLQLNQPFSYTTEQAQPAPITAPTAAVASPPQTYSALRPGVSVVDYLKSVNMPSDFASRARMAEEKGITNYRGTADQNIKLLRILTNQSIQTGQPVQTIIKKEVAAQKKTDKIATKQPTNDKQYVDHAALRARLNLATLNLKPGPGAAKIDFRLGTGFKAAPKTEAQVPASPVVTPPPSIESFRAPAEARGKLLANFKSRDNKPQEFPVSKKPQAGPFGPIVSAPGYPTGLPEMFTKPATAKAAAPIVKTPAVKAVTKEEPSVWEGIDRSIDDFQDYLMSTVGSGVKTVEEMYDNGAKIINNLTKSTFETVRPVIEAVSPETAKMGDYYFKRQELKDNPNLKETETKFKVPQPKEAAPPAIITGDTIPLPGPIKDRYIIPSQIDLNQTKWGVRNRGDFRPIETEGGDITLFENFVPAKEYFRTNPGSKDTDSFIGVDDKGNVQTGTKKDFANTNFLISKTFSNKIIDFPKDASGKLKLKPSSPKASNKHLSPVITVLDDSGKQVEGKLNVLIPKGNKDTKSFGEITGGRVIFTSPDGKQKIFASGSPEDIANVFNEFKKKGNYPYVTAYTLDNGTYGPGLRKKSGKISTDDLKNYQGANATGSVFLYLKPGSGKGTQKPLDKGQEQPVTFKYKEIPATTPNIRTEKDESFKKGHSLKNEQSAIVLHHTGYSDESKTKSGMSKAMEGVMDQFSRPGESSHVVIDFDGTRYNFASPDKVTFHAGKSVLGGRDNVNDFAIGVEFQGDTNKKRLTDAQIESFVEYIGPIIKANNIPLDRIVTHEKIRKDYMDTYKDDKEVLPKTDLQDRDYQRIKKVLIEKGYYPAPKKQYGGDISIPNLNPPVSFYRKGGWLDNYK